MNSEMNTSTLRQNPITADLLLGDLVTMYPPVTTTLNRLDIDYCCQGNRPLQAAIDEKDLDGAEFLADLNTGYQVYAARRESQIDPSTLSNEDLILLIMESHHAPERKLMHDIDELVNKILVVHYEHDEILLKQLHRQYALLKMELEEHFADEENVLFPAIEEGDQTGDYSRARSIIAKLEKDHDAAGDLLKSIKALTHNYQAPGYACPTFRVTYAKIKALTEDIFLHIHKENSILFRRVSGTF